MHAEAPSYAETDWPQLLRLYGELLKAWPTPVVALNRVVPLAMTAGPERRLAEIERIERDGRLAGYRYLPAAKADLLRRLGRWADAGGAVPARAGPDRQRGRAGVPGRPDRRGLSAQADGG